MLEDIADDYHAHNFEPQDGASRRPPLTTYNRPPGEYVRKPPVRKPVEKVSLNQRREAIWVTYCSPEYRNFMK